MGAPASPNSTFQSEGMESELENDAAPIPPMVHRMNQPVEENTPTEGPEPSASPLPPNNQTPEGPALPPPPELHLSQEQMQEILRETFPPEQLRLEQMMNPPTPPQAQPKKKKKGFDIDKFLPGIGPVKFAPLLSTEKFGLSLKLPNGMEFSLFVAPGEVTPPPGLRPEDPVPGQVMPKMMVGSPETPQEQEADAIANQMVPDTPGPAPIVSASDFAPPPMVTPEPKEPPVAEAEDSDTGFDYSWEDFAGAVKKTNPLVGKKTTVTNSKAVIRKKDKKWTSLHKLIPIGSEVEIMETDPWYDTSPKYVKVRGQNPALSDVWEVLEDDYKEQNMIEYGWTLYSNLDPIFVASASTAGSTTGGKAVQAAPSLPKTDEDWQKLISSARGGVSLDTQWSFDEKALNSKILYEFRVTSLSDKQNKQFKKLVMPLMKAVKTYANLQKELKHGAFLIPGLLQEKNDLIDKRVKEGLLKIKFGKSGGFKASLTKGFNRVFSRRYDFPISSKVQDAMVKSINEQIRAFLKANSTDNLVQLDATKVTELKKIVKDGLNTFVTKVKSLEPKLKSKRDEAERTFKAIVAEKKSKKWGKKDQSYKELWEFVDALDTSEGILVDVPFTRYMVTMADDAEVILQPTIKASINNVRPGGHIGGKTERYNEGTKKKVIQESYAHVKDETERKQMEDTARRFINTLEVNEGRPDGMNSWDTLFVTAGPGLGAAGRLQKAMHEYKTAYPADFHSYFGQFGIDVEHPKSKVYYLTVRVPSDPKLRTDSMRDVHSDGKLIIGSSTAGHSMSSSKYKKDEASEFIAHDPVLLTRFMYAGRQASFQEFLLSAALDSIHKAEKLAFKVPDGTGGTHTVNWKKFVAPLGADYVAVTTALLGYRQHASGTKFENAKADLKAKYIEVMGTRPPAEATEKERLQLVQLVPTLMKSDKHGVYKKQFPDVADKVFPVKKKKEKK